MGVGSIIVAVCGVIALLCWLVFTEKLYLRSEEKKYQESPYSKKLAELSYRWKFGRLGAINTDLSDLRPKNLSSLEIVDFQNDSGFKIVLTPKPGDSLDWLTNFDENFLTWAKAYAVTHEVVRYQVVYSVTMKEPELEVVAPCA